MHVQCRGADCQVAPELRLLQCSWGWDFMMDQGTLCCQCVDSYVPVAGESVG